MSQTGWKRNGPDHRQGQAVGFAEVRRRFDFRSVRLGRWVTTDERDRAASAFYDALCDLMLILGGNETLIGLRGTLSLEYGLGGQLGVVAHYQPASRAFALAKNAGPGSIAHEWFHAFDHYIADKAFIDPPPSQMGSRAWLDSRPPQPHALNERLFRCYQAVMLDDSGQQPSALFRASTQADRERHQLYYSQPEELCARAFEAFVEDATIKNRFLVQGSRSSAEARAGLYPGGAERQRCNQAFADYFQALGRALKQNPTSGA
ncbi:CLCA_X family protein [Saccharospirillum mangrovi]|uniref:CLCA_X family protein n=1 Tax=Saccharospirillum mangrovi TaxID=2161747 RepID=UPI000D35857B|nr:CLCA_X family protein [Saccharospirillum mangrovi]